MNRPFWISASILRVNYTLPSAILKFEFPIQILKDKTQSRGRTMINFSLL